MRILLVEDEKYMAQALEQVLQKNNYAVDLAYDGEYGLDCALSGIYDVIILDIMLPKMNGLDVLKCLRNERVSTPVLLLTAKSETQDKVKGLDLGADDYLAKPFKTEELLARLRALTRRKETIAFNNALAYNDIELNPNSLVLYCGKKEFKLTLNVKRHIGIGVNGRLKSGNMPTRPCRIGGDRRILAEQPHAVIALFDFQKI